MIKFILLILTGAFGLLLVLGCSESLEPNGVFREKRILYSVLDPEKNEQIVYLEKSYKNEEEELNDDKAWKYDCEVVIWFKDSVKIFKPEVISIKDSLNNNEKVIAFVHSNFSPEENVEYEISARFPDGKSLTAKTKLPEVSKAFIAKTKNGEEKIQFLDHGENNQCYFLWGGEELLFNAAYFEMELYYELDKSAGTVQMKKRIPAYFELEKNKYVPKYLNPGNYYNAFLNTNLLDRVVSLIKEENEQNTGLKLGDVLLDLIVYDEELSNYYYSTGGYLKDILLAVDQSAHTNVNGGTGIFGSFTRKRIILRLDENYIKNVRIN